MLDQVTPLTPHVHVNLNVRGLAQSATMAINERSRIMKEAGEEVFRLGLGQSPFPVPGFVEQALKDNAFQRDYLPVRGLPALRRAIADYCRRHEGLEYSPDNILVGPGTKELMFLLQLVYYGDLVILTPSWVSYAPQAHIIGRHLQRLPTRIETGLGVTPEALEHLCERDPSRPRLLILNYPSNPTGMCYSPEQLQAIAEVARKYRVLLLSDEIYGGVHFAGEHISIARFYPEGTIISNGLSKWCGAGGWRLGAFVFPGSLSWLMDGMAAVASETFTSTSAPIQYAAVKAFEGGSELDDYLLHSRRILGALADYAWRTLIAAGAECTQPKGGFYLFPSFEALRERLQERGIDNGPDLCERLLEETGVATLPGEAFGRPFHEMSLRLAIVDFDGRAALEASRSHPEADLDESFVRCACPRVAEAIDRLAVWVGP